MDNLSRQSVFIVLVLLATTKATSITPRDLVDEATKQLEELKSIVKGQISVAHDDLEASQSDFQTYGVIVAQASQVSIEQEQATIDSQLTTIKDLAHAAGKDVSSCTDIREQVLSRLPQTYIDAINKAISVLIQEVLQIVSDARYIVDVSINKVYQLENQLNSCKGEILCISPLITEIQLNKIRLPQNIKTEVQAAEGLITTLRVSVESDGNNGVAEYTSDASSILSDVILCVNRIIG